MKKTKVAIFHTIISPTRVSLFNEIAKSNEIDLKVYFLNEKSFERTWNLKIYKNKINFKYEVLKSNNIKIPYFPIEYNFNPSIFSILKKEKYDVIISTGWVDFVNQVLPFLKNFFNFKFILWAGSTSKEPSILRKLSTSFVKQIINNSDSFISYGTESTNYLTELGANPKKITPAYNPIDNKIFSIKNKKVIKTKEKIKKTIGNDVKIVLYVGQLIKRKGIDLLIKALSLNKEDNVILFLQGSGELKNYYLSLCKKFNVKVVIFDHIEYIDLPFMYQLADIFVLPSREEVWGLVVNEAMASQLPVIVSDQVGCTTDILKNGLNGFTFKNKSIFDLHLKLSFLIKNNKVRHTMAKNSKKIIRTKGVIQASKVFIKVIKTNS